MSDENIIAPTTIDYSLHPQSSYLRTKTRLEFRGSCLKQDKITHSHEKIVNIYIIYELDKISTKTSPTVVNYLFGAVSLTKNADIDKHKYSGYGIGFDRRNVYLFGDGFGRNVITFGVNMSSSVHIDNKGEYILISCEGPTQGLENKLTAEKLCSINFTENNKKFCLSLNYNGANSYLFVNGKEIHKSKARYSEIVATPLCLGNISKDWSVGNMKKTELTGYVYDFSVGCDAIAVDILDMLHIRHLKAFNEKE